MNEEKKIVDIIHHPDCGMAHPGYCTYRSRFPRDNKELLDIYEEVKREGVEIYVDSVEANTQQKLYAIDCIYEYLNDVGQVFARNGWTIRGPILPKVVKSFGMPAKNIEGFEEKWRKK